MQTVRIKRQGPAEEDVLKLSGAPVPTAGGAEVLVRVTANGVCRTDLHIIEGDLPLRKPGVVPGHQIVGVVEETGEDVTRFQLGDRIGAGWLHSTCGMCVYCQSGRENLCESAKFTGWDVDGGYAEYALLNEDFAFAIPETYSDTEAAPLLCGGVIGYRALRLTGLQRGQTLGIYGFGSSAHMIAQVAIHEGQRVRVYTRGESRKRLALELGAEWAGDALNGGPDEFDGAVIFAPAGELVPLALRSLRRGGTVTLAGIHMSPLPSVDYSLLYGERVLRSVANFTVSDAEELLRVASDAGVKPRVTTYPLADAAQAIRDLKSDRVTGSAVLVPGNG